MHYYVFWNELYKSSCQIRRRQADPEWSWILKALGVALKVSYTSPGAPPTVADVTYTDILNSRQNMWICLQTKQLETAWFWMSYVKWQSNSTIQSFSRPMLAFCTCKGSWESHHLPCNESFYRKSDNKAKKLTDNSWIVFSVGLAIPSPLLSPHLSVLFRMTCLSAICLTQAWMMWKFINFQLKKWREQSQNQASKKKTVSPKMKPSKKDSSRGEAHTQACLICLGFSILIELR